MPTCSSGAARAACSTSSAASPAWATRWATIVLGSLRDYPACRSRWRSPPRRISLTRVASGEGVVNTIWHTYWAIEKFAPSRRRPPCTPPASSTARSALPRSTASTSRWRSPPCCCCSPTVLLGWRREPFADLGMLAGDHDARRCSPMPSSAACCRTRMTAMARAWSGSRRSWSRCCSAGCMPGAARPRTAGAGSPARWRRSPFRRRKRPCRLTCWRFALLFPPQGQCYKAALAPGSTCVPLPLAALAALLPSSCSVPASTGPARSAPARPTPQPTAAVRHHHCRSTGRSGTASGCSAARPTSSATSSPTAPAASSPPSICSNATPAAAAGRRTMVDHLCVNAAGARARHLRARRRARKLSRAEDPSGRRAARRRGAARRDLQLELRRRHHPAQAGQRALLAAGAAAPRLRQADHRRRRHHAAGQQRRQRLGRDRGARSADRGAGRLGRRRRRQSRPADRARRRGLLLPALPRRGARRIFPAEPARLQGRQGLRRQPRRLAPPPPATGTATARAGCRRPATARSTAISSAPRSRSRSRTRRSRSPSCRSPAAARPSRAACSARRAPATAR